MGSWRLSFQCESLSTHFGSVCVCVSECADLNICINSGSDEIIISHYHYTIIIMISSIIIVIHHRHHHYHNHNHHYYHHHYYNLHHDHHLSIPIYLSISPSLSHLLSHSASSAFHHVEHCSIISCPCFCFAYVLFYLKSTIYNPSAIK